MNNKNKSTIKDVAKKTGYSTQTVSRVVNNSPKVKEETRKIILKAIKELEYKPNFYARNLNSKKNINILISIRRDKIHEATIWLNNLVNEIILANKSSDISIFVEQFYEKLELEKSLLYTTSDFIDGVIIFNKSENNIRVNYLKDNKIPYVVFGKSNDKDEIFIASDDYNSVIKGTNYLLDRNIKKIDFMTANISTTRVYEREKGIEDAYKNKGIDISNLNIIRGISTREKAYNTVLKKIEEKNLPEAIFVSGDEKAIGVLRALNEKNVKIPEDIMVLGYDNIPISEYYYPSLTTIDLDYKKMALKLFDKIVNLINGEEENSEFIKGELVERNSTRK